MDMTSELGKVIIINGPSSAGKSTLAHALQASFDIPFINFSFDLFLDSKALPRDGMKNGKFNWAEMRPSVFSGVHHCLPALAGAGNNLIMDHIIEEQSWLDELVEILIGFDVFFVGLHCSIEELERRENARGNRRVGDARRDLETVHSFAPYDLEIIAEEALERNVEKLIHAWHKRKPPTVFEKLATGLDKKVNARLKENQ